MALRSAVILDDLRHITVPRLLRKASEGGFACIPIDESSRYLPDGLRSINGGASVTRKSFWMSKRKNAMWA